MLLYVKTRDLLPMKLNDSWEVAYVLFGRKSIFVVCGVLFVFAWILCVLSYMTGVETLCSIIYGILESTKKGYEGGPEWVKWLTVKENLIIVGGVLRLMFSFFKDRETFFHSTYTLRLVFFVVIIYAQLF